VIVPEESSLHVQFGDWRQSHVAQAPHVVPSGEAPSYETQLPSWHAWIDRSQYECDPHAKYPLRDAQAMIGAPPSGLVLTLCWGGTSTGAVAPHPAAESAEPSASH
jgi:hypothetical protein